MDLNHQFKWFFIEQEFKGTLFHSKFSFLNYYEYNFIIDKLFVKILIFFLRITFVALPREYLLNCFKTLRSLGLIFMKIVYGSIF